MLVLHVTGAWLDGAEMLACGLATYFVPSSVSYILLYFCAFSADLHLW